MQITRVSTLLEPTSRVLCDVRAHAARRLACSFLAEILLRLDQFVCLLVQNLLRAHCNSAIRHKSRVRLFPTVGSASNYSYRHRCNCHAMLCLARTLRDAGSDEQDVQRCYFVKSSAPVSAVLPVCMHLENMPLHPDSPSDGTASRVSPSIRVIRLRFMYR